MAPDEEFQTEENFSQSYSSNNLTNGILDSNTVAQGLKTLGVHPLEHRHTFLELSLNSFSLEFIDILRNYTKIMYLDISNNNIKSLKPLENMTCLIHLNAKNNQITECLDIAPPLCNHDHAWKDGHHAVGSMLTLVDLSFNKITRIGDLSKHPYLECLLLSNNQISEIEGLQSLEYLQTLDLSCNNIATIQGLDHLPLRELNLAHNKIRELTGLNTLVNLTALDASYNLVMHLAPLQQCMELSYINLAHNFIPFIRHVEFLTNLPWLQTLLLCDNPCQQKEQYRLRVIFRLCNLIKLDHSNVSHEEKIRAYNLYNPVQGDLLVRKEVFERYHPDTPFVDYSEYQLTYDDEEDLLLDNPITNIIASGNDNNNNNNIASAPIFAM